MAHLVMTLNSEAQRLHQDVRAAEKEVGQLRAEVDRLKAEDTSALTSKVVELSAQVRSFEAGFKSKSDALLLSEARRSELRTKVEALERQVAAKEAEAELCSSAQKAAESELASVQAQLKETVIFMAEQKRSAEDTLADEVARREAVEREAKRSADLAAQELDRLKAVHAADLEAQVEAARMKGVADYKGSVAFMNDAMAFFDSAIIKTAVSTLEQVLELQPDFPCAKVQFFAAGLKLKEAMATTSAAAVTSAEEVPSRREEPTIGTASGSLRTNPSES